MEGGQDGGQTAFHAFILQPSTVNQLALLQQLGINGLKHSVVASTHAR